MKPIAILWAILVLVLLAIIMGIALAVATKYLAVKEDPRKDVTLKMLPGVNCGGCGFPGCAGLADALIEGQEKHVKKCVVIKSEKAQELVDYLNTTPDAEGETLKVEL